MPGRTRIACLVVALTLAAVGVGDAHAIIIKRLDYETGSFSQWTAVQAVVGGARIVRSPFHEGRFGDRFVVRPGDNPNSATGARADGDTNTAEGEGTATSGDLT